MSDKLYAVTTGDYDYYDIVALCTSKRKAQEIAERLQKEMCYDIVTVEEYDNAENCDIDVYRVVFEHDNYKLRCCELEIGNHGAKEFEIIQDKTNYLNTYRVKVHANSRAEAIKAARDKLTKYKAREFGLNEKAVEI